MTTHAVIFGGSGFIGRWLTTELASQGGDVTVADIVPPSWDLPSNCRYVYCDVRNPIRDIDPAQEVYLLAAIHRVPGHADWEYADTNVRGAHEVLHFAKSVDAKYLCFASSISVYGSTEIPVDEVSDLRPTTAYGQSKKAAEEILRSGWDEKLTIVRPAVIFGPGENGNFTRLAAALRGRRFVYVGRRDTVKSCGYVEELVRAIMFARDLPQQEFIFNFCYPEVTRIDEICQAFHAVAGLSIPRIVVPLKGLLMAGRLLEILDRAGIHNSVDRVRIRKLYDSTYVLPSALVKSQYDFRTDLIGGLRDWLSREPKGQFV